MTDREQVERDEPTASVRPVSVRRRARQAWFGIRHEGHWARRHVVEGRWGYLADVLAYRALAILPDLPTRGRQRRLVVDDGTVVHYRRERADIQGIREIFIDEIYRLPDGVDAHSLVDLGANIGLASIWLARHHRLSGILAVEPLEENLRILRRNLEANGLDALVVAAAIGPRDGVARFAADVDANLGRIDDEGGVEVPVAAISRLLREWPCEPSLLKMDIEGAEGPLLLEEAPVWLDGFDAVVAELHPQYLDITPVVEAICARGFEHHEGKLVSDGIERKKRERLFIRR